MSSHEIPSTPGIMGLLVCNDFIFITRICDTARAMGRKVQTVKDAAAIQQQLQNTDCRLLIIDLHSGLEVLPEVPNLIAQWPQLHVISFASHVNKELLQQGREAGCHATLPRSRFTKELVKLLETHLPQ